MRGPVRVALATALAGLLLPVAAEGATAAVPRPVGADATVRLVVRTEPGAARAVTRAAERRGATRVGRVRRLHALSFVVAAGEVGRWRARLGRRDDVTSVGLAHRRWFTDEPADPRFGQQRDYLNATGETAAWDRGALGSPEVRIAVVDSGVNVHHPDLAGKIVGTYNAVTGGRDVRDVVGHGTGTASVAAAATGNGEGMAGSGRDTSLLAVKVADITGRIFTDDLAAGIVWAVDHGADVVNLSLGGPTSDGLERAAVEYAQAHDVLVVAAAGNEGSRAKQYPAALPGVLGVGATSETGSSRAPFSSFGSWVDLGAPGRSIVAATADGGYEVADGTSYSTPLVSGAAALLSAYRPGRSADQLAQALIGGTDSAKLGFAHGLLHVDRSLDLLPPATAPTITAPAAGSTVAGSTTVTVSSSAPRVRLGLGDLRQTVSTTGGVGSATFETFGLGGSVPVSAADCSAVDQCSAQESSAGVTVDNGFTTLTSPGEGSAIGDDTVRVSADAAGGAVRLFIDDTRGVIDGSAPYAADLSTAGLTNGQHLVKAVVCRSDGSVCDYTRMGQVAVTVTRLHPGIRSVKPTAISPGSDGRRDETTVVYQLDRRQAPSLVVRNAAGTVVLRRNLGSQAAGRHDVTWDGRNDAGRFVADGRYDVAISTSDGALKGLVATTVRVDRSGPRLGRPRLSARRLLPAKDGYLDTVAVAARPREALRRLDLQVRTRSGALVRTVHGGHAAVKAGLVRWNGRADGHRVAPGSYRIRLLGEDVAGNRHRTGARTLVVSGARLRLRHGSTTVTARGSLEETFADDCSEVFRRTSGRHAGWVAYGSSSTCTSRDAFAAADHQVRLPNAVRYGRVRVSAYGGRGDRRYRDSARLVLYDNLQNLSDHSFRLGPSIGQHTGDWVQAEPLVIRSRVLRWMTIATGVSWYDVKSYRVDYTYFVLR
jgi:hypothetical protein